MSSMSVSTWADILINRKPELGTVAIGLVKRLTEEWELPLRALNSGDAPQRFLGL